MTNQTWFPFSLSLLNTHTHTVGRTVMSMDRLLRSTLRLCDSSTPGGCCGDGRKLSPLKPPDAQIQPRTVLVYPSVLASKAEAKGACFSGFQRGHRISMCHTFARMNMNLKR